MENSTIIIVIIIAVGLYLIYTQFINPQMQVARHEDTQKREHFQDNCDNSSRFEPTNDSDDEDYDIEDYNNEVDLCNSLKDVLAEISIKIDGVPDLISIWNKTNKNVDFRLKDDAGKLINYNKLHESNGMIFVRFNNSRALAVPLSSGIEDDDDGHSCGIRYEIPITDIGYNRYIGDDYTPICRYVLNIHHTYANDEGPIGDLKRQLLKLR